MTATIRKPLMTVRPRSISVMIAHLRHEGPAGVLDRLGGVGLLGAGVGEELHRLDVGVAVDDPPGDRRAGVGEGLGRLADAGDRPGDEPEVEAEPDDERQAEAEVGAGEEPERADEVDDGVDHGVEGLEGRLAHGGGGLHHPVGDAAGEVGLEPVDRLAQHVAVAAPAHDGADVGHKGLIYQGGAGGLDQRAGEEDEGGDQRELEAVAGPDLGGRRLARGRRRCGRRTRSARSRSTATARTARTVQAMTRRAGRR